MKKLFLSIILSVFIATVSLAQDSNEKIVVKEKTFQLFGNHWIYQKYSDKSWTVNTEECSHVIVEIEGAKKRRYEKSLNIDLGINTWANAPSLPAIKPWGSWNIGLNYQHIYSMGKNFTFNPALGVSWYNFKLEDADLIPIKTDDGILFESFEDGEGTKSKISASYANLSLIPSYHSENGKIRIGLGPYIGYRLGGRGKFVYKDAEGKSHKKYEKSNMYSNDLRYGGRLTLGVGEVDFYLNYDLNPVFQTGKGPEVNALSFGLIL
ncbi:PorT family protein [Echinicola marina]|uniref:outer membrane beta-barrel protein n=1 Tax=Echinicola marina TaxID=2859768 RepID=UPI001CF684BE|nr:outer membrane beta-barrel protein [Echinicola marina]UCS93797.1 PorT family protein [Echinicola marina]